MDPSLSSVWNVKPDKTEHSASRMFYESIQSMVQHLRHLKEQRNLPQYISDLPLIVCAKAKPSSMSTRKIQTAERGLSEPRRERVPIKESGIEGKKELRRDLSPCLLSPCTRPMRVTHLSRGVQMATWTSCSHSICSHFLHNSLFTFGGVEVTQRMRDETVGMLSTDV